MSEQPPPPNPHQPSPHHRPPPGTFPTPAHGGVPPHGTPSPYGAPPPPGAPPPYGGPPYGALAPYGAPPAAPALPLAHRGKRLLARMIDALIMTLLATALITPLMIFVTSKDPHGETAWVGVGVVGSLLLLFGSWILYEGLQLARWGRTLGKRWMGLRVVSADPPGAPLTRGRAIGRAAVYPPGFVVVNVLPLVGVLGTLNVLWQFWDKPFHQCLHDKIAHTVVIEDRGRAAPGT